MRYRKDVPQEKKEYLSGLLKQYVREVEMTGEERTALHKWVASGNSPYENGDFLCFDNCRPMDFISAYRAIRDEIEWFNGLSEKDRECVKKAGYTCEYYEMLLKHGEKSRNAKTDECLEFLPDPYGGELPFV